MSKNTRNYTSRSKYTRSGGYGEYYIDGNTARKIDVRKEIHKAPTPIENPDVQRRVRERHVHMNFGYVVFLMAALVLSSVILVNYINIQAQNKALKETIARKESQLNSMKMANDEEYSRIISSVDLAYVKDVAINELGMQYAEEGQVVTIETQGDDYVRQYAQMP